MRRDSLRRLAPGVIVALAVGLILLTAGTGVMVTRHLQQDALNISRLYSGVFAGLNDPSPGAEAGALLQLGERVLHLLRAAPPLDVVLDPAGDCESATATVKANVPAAFGAPARAPDVASS